MLTKLAICYAYLGRTLESQEMVERILAMKPDFRISTFRRGVWPGEHLDHMRKGMILAGLPE